MNLKIEQISQRRFAVSNAPPGNGDDSINFGERYDESIRLRREITEWAKENGIGVDLYRPGTAFSYFFIAVLYSEAQAFAFKLRWM